MATEIDEGSGEYDEGPWRERLNEALRSERERTLDARATYRKLPPLRREQLAT
jgi:hypothetical protein